MSQYCEPSDITLYSIPATAIPAAITNDMQVAACIAASAEVDSYIRARYSLPLAMNYPTSGPPFTTYDPALVKHTAYIAAYSLMSQRGYAPVAGSDNKIENNYFKAVGWPDRPGSGYFPGVERGHIHLDVVQATVNPPKYYLPQIWSKPPRGI